MHLLLNEYEGEVREANFTPQPIATCLTVHHELGFGINRKMTMMYAVGIKFGYREEFIRKSGNQDKTNMRFCSAGVAVVSWQTWPTFLHMCTSDFISACVKIKTMGLCRVHRMGGVNTGFCPLFLNFCQHTVHTIMQKTWSVQ